MPFVDWNDRLSVGVPSIDAQHRQLVDLINQLHDSMKIGKGQAALLQVLESLLTYTKSHFAHEEKLLGSAGYADLPAHQATHRKLTAEVQALHQKMQARSAVLTMDVMSFLRTWLTDHIMQTDQRYAALLQQAGVR